MIEKCSCRAVGDEVSEEPDGFQTSSSRSSRCKADDPGDRCIGGTFILPANMKLLLVLQATWGPVYNQRSE